MLITVISTLISVVLGLLLVYTVRYYTAKLISLEAHITKLETDHKEEKKKIKKDSTFRSSAVNWGKSIENFAPFIDTFPIPAEDVNFLGMPIDFIGFTETESKTKCQVHFIEIKSGSSFLSQKQKNIKKAIEEGRVQWHEVRMESNPTKKVVDQ